MAKTPAKKPPQAKTAVTKPAKAETPPLPAKIQDCVFVLSCVERDCSSTLETFKRDFDTDPLHAFEWGDSAFKAACLRSAARTLRELLEKRALLEHQILGWISARLVQSSRQGTSTSPTSNLVRAHMSRAWADLYEKLQFEVVSDEHPIEKWDSGEAAFTR